MKLVKPAFRFSPNQFQFRKHDRWVVVELDIHSISHLKELFKPAQYQILPAIPEFGLPERYDLIDVHLEDLGHVNAICYYTKEKFIAKDGIVLGSVIPQVSLSYLCHPLLGVNARKESVQLFDLSEANCNTCKHLQRVKFDNKQRLVIHGTMPGICKSTNADMDNHPYNNVAIFPEIKFAPEDWMGMSCHEPR